MNPLVAVALGAAIVCAGLIVALQPLLMRYALARPNARSSHITPTPQGGGIAVIAAALAAIAGAAGAFGMDAAMQASLLRVGAATLLLAVVGGVDDIRPMAVTPRLILQTVAVAAILSALPDGARIVPALPLWLERAALLVAGIYVVNLVNFMDGIDWMTVAEVVPVAAGLLLLSQWGALGPAQTLAAAALLGAIVGFAPFNRPVAKLFLGDVGSLPVGLLLFWMLTDLATRGHVAAALLLPLYYLADASITLLRRLRQGENVFRAHRTHFYQRATDLGFSVTEIVARVFAVNLVLVALAAASVVWPSAAVRIATLALGAATVGGLLAHLSRSRR